MPFQKVLVTSKVETVKQTSPLGFIGVRTDRVHVRAIPKTSCWQGCLDDIVDSVNLEKACHDETYLIPDRRSD
jgi:hypothetical protein